jgi:hypothetical protein
MLFGGRRSGAEVHLDLLVVPIVLVSEHRAAALHLRRRGGSRPCGERIDVRQDCGGSWFRVRCGERHKHRDGS